MSSMQIAFAISVLLACAAGLIAEIFFLCRNRNVYKVRIEFINNDVLWNGLYKKLPCYEEMLYSPKHFGRWSTDAWIEYAEGKS